jgi:hypothetical protein
LKKINRINVRAATSGEKITFGKELLFGFHVIGHPFDGFWDLKHEKRGSVRAGTTILLFTVVAFFYQAIGRGYTFNPRGDNSTIFMQVLAIVVPVILWCVGNWCLTTLFDGEGSFKDIFIATSYCLLPVPITVIPCTLISNFVIDTEVEILSFVETLGIIYMVILVFIGMMVTHDYTMGKNIITTAGTIIAMVFIMFVAALFSTLLIKIVGFVSNIVVELKYRM